MNPESFFTWGDLVTYSGATLAVLIIVQFTKELPGIKKIPTRLWAYILSVMILVLATVFTTSPITPSIILLCIVNAVIVALAAVGGYHTVADMKALPEIPEL
jgi:uncharacterized membrane protein